MIVKKRGKYRSKFLEKLDKNDPTGKKYKKAKKDYKYTDVNHDLITWEDKGYNLVSSVAGDAIHPNFLNDEINHYPVIDIDFPVYAVPSRTPGHTHLYIEKSMKWKTYRKLLKALAEAGIIEKGYADACIARKCGLLRNNSYERLLEIAEEVKEESNTIQVNIDSTNPTLDINSSAIPFSHSIIQSDVALIDKTSSFLIEEQIENFQKMGYKYYSVSEKDYVWLTNYPTQMLQPPIIYKDLDPF